MTPQQRAAALRLIRAFDNERISLPAWESVCRQGFALLRELAAEPVQEPVAWHVCSVNSDGSLSLEFAASWEESAHEHINDAINEYDIDGATSWVVRPVYAAPQQPMRCPKDGGECGAGGYCRPEQRKPLLASDIVTMYAECPTCDADMIDFARAIERAHGITGEQK